MTQLYNFGYLDIAYKSIKAISQSHEFHSLRRHHSQALLKAFDQSVLQLYLKELIQKVQILQNQRPYKMTIVLKKNHALRYHLVLCRKMSSYTRLKGVILNYIERQSCIRLKDIGFADYQKVLVLHYARKCRPQMKYYR